MPGDTTTHGSRPRVAGDPLNGGLVAARKLDDRSPGRRGPLWRDLSFEGDGGRNAPDIPAFPPEHTAAGAESMLFVTYDEHGGCYDHVPPPNHATPPDATPGESGFPFNRFGVRVPTVVVSPGILPGTIARPAGHTPFDHTTIIAHEAYDALFKTSARRPPASPTAG